MEIPAKYGNSSLVWKYAYRPAERYDPAIAFRIARATEIENKDLSGACGAESAFIDGTKDRMNGPTAHTGADMCSPGNSRS
jgi:hypothetical protein